MEHAAKTPALLHALEQSAWGGFVRDATLLYPIANTLHVVFVLVFFAAVAAMDTRLLGWYGGTAPTAIIARFRPVALLALAGAAATGFVLFTPEATAIFRNAAFRLKGLAIVLAALNLLALEMWLRQPGTRAALAAPDAVPVGLPRRVAGFSLALWLFVAACGRFIAYA